MRIALIGLGAIGQGLLDCLASAPRIEIAGALVAHPERRSKAACCIFASLDELLAARPTLVVECASQRSLREHGPKVLAAGCDLLASSVGALANEATLATLGSAARQADTQLFVPSGALAGIDALAAARHVGLAAVRYERRAPPATWIRSGALSADKSAATAPFEVFAGSAREAALRFPKNANVAATIALAGVGFDATRVVLIADPSHAGNTHSIHAQGAFGEFHARICATTLSAASTSSRIVAGSLARAVLSHVERIVV